MRSAAALVGAVRVTKVRFSAFDRAALRNSKRSRMRSSVIGVGWLLGPGLNNTIETMRNSGRRSWAAFSLRKAISWASVGADVVPAMACVTLNQRPSRVSSA
ncbi:hypothetical protein D3C86_1406820 [compost metagenome]